MSDLPCVASSLIFSSDSFTIYVLQLQEGKYYVGATRKPLQRRLDEHQRQGATCAEWTKKYPLIRCIDYYETNDIHEETTKTKNLMNQFGIDNVRGGAYSSMELSKEDRKTLNKEFDHDLGLCLRCKKPGHLAKLPRAAKGFFWRSDSHKAHEVSCSL